MASRKSSLYASIGGLYEVPWCGEETAGAVIKSRSGKIRGYKQY